ncbi:hypothetical protein Ancab_009283 [Ancistrocladus abbreviatus]
MVESTHILPKSRILDAAIQEMQKANYFAFIMLLNMSPANQLPGNITFLMPNDRTLAKATIPADSLLGFLLKHSIPSPLLFDCLEHFPTGSKIPSSETGYMLKVTNNGRRNYFLNNVKIVSPNICVGGRAIRCHGIDGVLFDTNNTLPSFTCPTTGPVVVATPPTLPLQPSPPPLAIDFNLTPAGAPQPAGLGTHSRHSGSSKLFCCRGIVESSATFVIMLILW